MKVSKKCHTVRTVCDTDVTWDLTKNNKNVTKENFLTWKFYQENLHLELRVLLKKSQVFRKILSLKWYLTSNWHGTWPFYDVNYIEFYFRSPNGGFKEFLDFVLLHWVTWPQKWFSQNLVVAVKRYRHCLNN